MKNENQKATIAEVLKLYGDEICAFASIKPATALKNLQSVRLILKAAKISESEGLERLNYSALSRWRKSRYLGREFGTHPSLNYSLNSTFTQAKSVFSRRALELYAMAKIGLPESLKGFLNAPLLRPSKSPTFEAIDPEADAQIKADCAEALKGGHSPLDAKSAIMIELARFCGLTNSEIHAFNLGWIKRDEGGAYIEICTRDPEGGSEAFATKRESKDRIVPISLERLSLWESALKSVSIPYFGSYKAHTHTNSQYRKVCNYLGEYIKSPKKLHELRKMACSEVLAREGDIYKAAKFIGDSVNTTAKYYAAQLERIAPL